LLLAAIRNIPEADRDVKNDLWKNHTDLKIKHSGLDMYGKTVGIWGMGKIGKHAAPMLNGFGVKVIYNDITRLSPEEEQGLGVAFRSIDDFFAAVDYLLVLLPLNEKTIGIMNEKIFQKIRKPIVLVNSARAGLIEEAALKHAVENNRVTACALDVIWKEASPLPDWIKNNKRIIVTPHLGGSTKECDMELVDEVISFFKKEPGYAEN
jgi:phosphoglycerate dehydrogenase-like enzyme